MLEDYLNSVQEDGNMNMRKYLKFKAENYEKIEKELEKK